MPNTSKKSPKTSILKKNSQDPSTTQKLKKSLKKPSKNPKKPPIDIKKIKQNPIFKQRIALQSVIILITIIIAIVFADTRGYWALISAFAVLVCEDIAKIPQRGALRMIGAIAGFLAGSLLAMINFGIVSTILFLALGIFLIIRFLPTEKYALGSAGIGLVAVAIASITEGAFSWRLLWERLFWTIIGAIIAIVFVSIGIKIYEKKTSKIMNPTSSSKK